MMNFYRVEMKNDYIFIDSEIFKYKLIFIKILYKFILNFKNFIKNIF